MFLCIRTCAVGILLFFVAKSASAQEYITAFVGAQIIDGSGKPPIAHGILLIQHGRIIATGAENGVVIPSTAIRIDCSGKTIMPGIINAHGHAGNLKKDLATYARYGVTTVISLGGEKRDAEPFRQVNNSEVSGRSRLYIAGQVINGKTIEEVLAVVDSNHRMGVDLMKIRVDDQLGTSSKMPAEIYSAIIRHSHQLGYRVATHMYGLDDAKKLLEAGSDLLAHSVRDKPVDADFISLILSKKVGYCPTLTRELSTFVYGDTATFFHDSFFQQEYTQNDIQELLDPARQLQVRESVAAKTYKQQLPVAMANLKTLSNNGVPIVFGTDSGIPTRFVGYFEHVEMKMMVEAGLTAMQVIVSASKNAAAWLGIKDLGTLTKNNFADFLILDADPLEDILNTRKIHAVYIGGIQVQKK